MDNKELRNTTREEMKSLEMGDTFVVYGREHIASTDSHISGDATCDEYIVYDEDNEGWFETDFPEGPVASLDGEER